MSKGLEQQGDLSRALLHFNSTFSSQAPPQLHCYAQQLTQHSAAQLTDRCSNTQIQTWRN